MTTEPKLDDDADTLVISIHAQEQIRRRVRGGIVPEAFLDELARIASSGPREADVQRNGMFYAIRDGVLVTVYPCGASKRPQNLRMLSR